MASDTNHKPAENAKKTQDTIVNGDDGDEKHYLLASSGMRHTSQHALAVHGGIQRGQNNEDNLLESVTAQETSASRARPPCGVKEFPYFRGRVTALAIIVCYVINAYTTDPLQTQYFHHRFTPDFFNDTAASQNASNNVFSNCHGNNTSQLARQESALQEHVSHFRLYLSYSSYAPTIIATVVLCSMSDVVGRRVLFLFPCVMLFVKQVICLFAMKLDLPLWVFYVANIVDGLSGSFCTAFAAGFAYAADLTPVGKARTFAIVVAECAIYMASVASQLVVGYLLQNYGFFYGSLGPTAFAGFAILIGLFLPESISAHGPSNTRRSCVNPFKYLKNVFGFYILEGSIKQRFLFCLPLLILAMIFASSLSQSGVSTLYQLNLPFCWSPSLVGLYGAVSTAGKAVFGLPAVHLLQKSLSDSLVISVGMVSTLASFILTGLANNDFMLYLAAGAGLLSAITSPVCRSILSKMAGKEKQGALFASIAVTEGISTFVSSTLYNTIYAATVAHMRGAVFFIMAGIVFAALIFVLIFKCLYDRSEDRHSYEKIVASSSTNAKE